jgi:hypothetical protein
MDQVQSLLGRPQEYYNIDGVGELSIGFMSLSWALLGWLQMRAPEASAWHQMYTFVIYVAVMMAALHFGPKVIKNRITYPRTGYVEYRACDKRWIPLGLGAAVSVVFTVGLAVMRRKHWDISTAASLMGLLLAASYVRIAQTVRWKWGVFAAIVAGTGVIATLPTEVLERVANQRSLTASIPAKAAGVFWLTFAMYGVMLVASGAVSFWLYLRHTEAPAQGGE